MQGCPQVLWATWAGAANLQSVYTHTPTYTYNLASADSCGEMARYVFWYRSSLLSTCRGLSSSYWQLVECLDSSRHRHVAGTGVCGLLACGNWGVRQQGGSGRRMAAGCLSDAWPGQLLVGVCVLQGLGCCTRSHHSEHRKGWFRVCVMGYDGWPTWYNSRAAPSLAAFKLCLLCS